MNSIGSSIKRIRISKGITQEELAEKASLNIKTIQRIENEINPPKEKTLELICHSLDINKESLYSKSQIKWYTKTTNTILNIGFIVLINILIILIFGYLTIPQEATKTSKIGAIILSPFFYFFILFITPTLSRNERLTKFGLAIPYYFIFRVILNGFEYELDRFFRSGLVYCLLIAILVTYYGNYLFKIVTLYNKEYNQSS